jgi:hypothetical protein
LESSRHVMSLQAPENIGIGADPANPRPMISPERLAQRRCDNALGIWRE